MFRKSFALFLLCLSAQPAYAEIIDIDNAELTRLAAKGVPVIDIRTEGEWRSSGIIAGSKLITFFDEKGQANPPQWLEKLKPIAKPNQPVILICRSGNRTKAATRFLSDQAGYKTVYNVSKGLNSWLSEGHSVVPATASMATCPLGASRCG